MINTNISLAGYEATFRAMQTPITKAAKEQGVTFVKYNPTSDDALTDALFAPWASASRTIMGYFYNEPSSQEKAKAKLQSLVNERQQLMYKMPIITKSIRDIEKEMTVKKELFYQRVGATLLQVEHKNYFETYKALLLNLKEQVTVLAQLNPEEPMDTTTIDEKIATVDTMLQGMTLPKEPALLDGAAAFCKGVVTDVASAAVYAAEQAKALVETATQLATSAIEGSEALKLLKSSEAEIEAAKVEYRALVSQIEKNGLSDENLVALNEKTKNLMALINAREEQKALAEADIKTTTMNLIKAHPTATKTIVKTIAVSIGVLLGNAAIAITMNAAIDKFVDGLRPCDAQAESNAETVASGLIQTVGCLLLGGRTAALISGGSAALKFAPQEVQSAVGGAAAAYAAQNAGFSLFASLGIGAGFALVLHNSFFIAQIKRDVKKACSFLKEHKLKALPKVILAIGEEIATYGKKVFTAIREGKKSEAIVRSAAVALCAVGIVFSLWAIPATVALFYLVNRAFTSKYRGDATLTNESFRSYVVQQYNEGEVKSVEKLFEILKKENEEFNGFHSEVTALNEALKEDESVAKETLAVA